MFDKEKYWNDYYDYWKEKVKDEKYVPPDDVIEWLLIQADLKGRILEVGCGFGRLFPFYSELDVKVSAIDISEKMVNEARKHLNDNIVEIIKAEAEDLPYVDNFFDFVICVATFDALEQEKALSEMLRVLKIGGKLLITGKNIDYLKNDTEASIAEVKAREHEHPNSFTDVVNLMFQLLEKCHRIVLEYYFLRRGDFSLKRFTKTLPMQFYEYFLGIKKGSDNIKFEKFSERFSNNE